MTPKHGDLLPIIGGPLDGETYMVTAIFQWTPGLLTKGFSEPAANGLSHWYERVDDKFMYRGVRDLAKEGV